MSDISKIKIIDNVYNVKDEEVRNVLNILLSGQKENITNENINNDSSLNIKE